MWDGDNSFSLPDHLPLTHPCLPAEDMSSTSKGVSMYAMLLDEDLLTINNRVAKLLCLGLFSEEGLEDLKTLWPITLTS